MCGEEKVQYHRSFAKRVDSEIAFLLIAGVDWTGEDGNPQYLFQPQFFAGTVLAGGYLSSAKQSSAIRAER
jgi:hypothetical protein